eukprot:4466936-Lingulodinium_polyedra.AAC.1
MERASARFANNCGDGALMTSLRNNLQLVHNDVVESTARRTSAHRLHACIRPTRNMKLAGAWNTRA